MARPNEAPDLLHWWEPRKIIIQMAILQAAYTLTATLLITLVILMMANPFRIDYFFLFQYYTGNNAFGLSLSLLSLVTALFTVLYLVLVVRRSQLILDFALTLQFWNLLLTTLYNGSLPNTGLWWSTKALESIIMVFAGRYFCRVRELRPIEFGSYEMVPTNGTAVEGDVEAQNGDVETK